jgi:peptidoglycan/LPS O-acetylase OafA/YrhL
MNEPTDQAKDDPKSPDASAGAHVPLEKVPELAPRLPSRRAPLWGTIWLVLGAFISYAAILGIATIVVGKRHGLIIRSDAVPRLFLYAGLIALLMWAGTKRRKRWESVLAIAFGVLGALAFIAHFGLTRPGIQGQVLNSAMMITAVVLVILAGVFFLLGRAQPRPRE